MIIILTFNLDLDLLVSGLEILGNPWLGFSSALDCILINYYGYSKLNNKTYNY